MLGADGRRVVVVTFNHRTDYGRLTREWAKRVHCEGRVDVANLYHWLAGETADDDVPPVAWQPPEDAVQASSSVWRRPLADGSTEEVRVDADGVLVTRAVLVGGARARREVFDRRGVARVAQQYAPPGDERGGSSHDEPEVEPGDSAIPSAGELIDTELRAGDGRPYARVRTAPDGTDEVCVLTGDAATGGEFVPVADLEARFVAALAGRPGAVIVVEDRASDLLVAANPYLVAPPRAIAVIHSSQLLAPHDDPHHVGSVNDAAFRLADRFSAVVVATRQQATDVRAHYGDVPNLVRIPHAVHVRRGAVAWRPRPGRLVFVGRLERVKRVDHVLRAFAKARETLPWARLDLWGAGTLLPELRVLAGELGVADAARFRGHTDDPHGVLARARASVMASASEGFGLTVLESLAVGTPVACYGFRYGPAELVRDGVTGRVVRSGDVDALAAAMVDLLRSGRRSKLLGLCGLEVRWRYRSRAVRRRWVRLVEGVGRSAG